MEPTLVFDDDCGFCTWWANWIEARSDLRLVGFSALESESDARAPADEPGLFDGLRARLPDDYQSCSHLVTDEAVYSCGASIEEALVRSEICQGLDLEDAVAFLRTFEDYNRFREGVYRWIADHRTWLGYVFRATPAAEASDDESGGGTDGSGSTDDGE